jgi:hypothetical protein
MSGSHVGVSELPRRRKWHFKVTTHLAIAVSRMKFLPKALRSYPRDI